MDPRETQGVNSADTTAESDDGSTTQTGTGFDVEETAVSCSCLNTWKAANLTMDTGCVKLPAMRSSKDIQHYTVSFIALALHNRNIKHCKGVSIGIFDMILRFYETYVPFSTRA